MKKRLANVTSDTTSNTSKRKSPRKKTLTPSKDYNSLLDLQGLKLGFLGDGQLARMMALEAHQLGLQTVVLSEDPLSPAAQVCGQRVHGSIKSTKDVLKLTEICHLLTFESEFVPSDILATLSSLPDKSSGPKIFPPLESIQKIQNRNSQKALLNLHKVPTSDWLPVKSQHQLAEAREILGDKIVLKKNFGGYDGNGTYILRSQIEETNFISQISKSGGLSQGFIAEKWIPFKRELAIILGRTRQGHFFHFPLVQTSQKDHRCDWVAGPIKHSKVSRILKPMQALLQSENYVGVIGVEMFDLGSEILVNELAPRVHNSGHYSQLAINPSQFKAHIQCGLGMAISPLQSEPFFVMTNLVGNSEKSIQVPRDIKGQLHLYGKQSNRPGRKMGHINYAGKNLKTLLNQAIKERARIQK